MNKTCLDCKVEKLIEDFYTSRRSNGGLKISSYCKPCDKIRASRSRNGEWSPRNLCREAPTGFRVCLDCDQQQPVENFYRNGYFSKVSGQEKVMACCKDCWRARVRLKSYGLTREQYDQMAALQNYGCAICGDDHSVRKDMKDLCVDHDHKTGRVRGLLCNSCNTALGHLRDSPERVKGLLLYLELHLSQAQ